MDSSSYMIPNPYKYHEWKAKIGILLHSKGLYRVSMDLENEPNVIVDKDKSHNQMDEDNGLLFLSIYLDLIFHIDGLTTPIQVWAKLESLFGVQDMIRAHQLENELISLSLRSFESMEGFFTKLNSLIIILNQCGFEKKEYQLMLSILSKLVPEYSIFVSIFHATRLDILNTLMVEHFPCHLFFVENTFIL